MCDVCVCLCALVKCVFTPLFTPIGRCEQRCEYVRSNPTTTKATTTHVSGACLRVVGVTWELVGPIHSYINTCSTNKYKKYYLLGGKYKVIILSAPQSISACVYRLNRNFL